MPAWEFGPLTRSHIVRYAGAGGDFSPIHHDEEFARSAGMPGVFGMGLLHGGLLGGSGWRPGWAWPPSGPTGSASPVRSGPATCWASPAPSPTSASRTANGSPTSRWS
ncbi:MaoC/PaaZ C-terminal domain-containing protein [Pseudonocardia alni]|uniref:MaoC/PaaZ C-terminal domain-containing protein n=1 Tax=Pseudonocardia alni TaxID=33907 RepID=UPI0033165B18